MPTSGVLQREILSGVTILEGLIAIGAVLLVLTIWNRVSRANMKLPGGR
jgi:hypothetical protein